MFLMAQRPHHFITDFTEVFNKMMRTDVYNKLKAKGGSCSACHGTFCAPNKSEIKKSESNR
jgi:cytochrome c556